MNTALQRLATVAVAVLLAGCGSNNSAAPSAAVTNTPDAAIREFLEAVKIGNHEKADSMLTDIARQKTKEMDLVVSPPGSETATFEVGEMEMVGPQEAHVASTWTDVGPDGQKHSDTIVWMLRPSQQGWKVSGMATRVLDDMPPLVLNFEDPEDMIRKQQSIEEEVIRRMNAANPAPTTVPSPTAQAVPPQPQTQLK
jgi:hypothetical protein